MVSPARRSSRGLSSWWLGTELEAVSLEEMLSNEAPDDLCDPITMTLFEGFESCMACRTAHRAMCIESENLTDCLGHAPPLLPPEPVVSISGETYSKATVARFENRIDPATREQIEDISRLPPNRALMRQVNAFIHRHLAAFATDIERLCSLPASAAETAADELEASMKALATILDLIKGRSDDASLNFKRGVLGLLETAGTGLRCAWKNKLVLSLVRHHLGGSKRAHVSV